MASARTSKQIVTLWDGKILCLKVQGSLSNTSPVSGSTASKKNMSMSSRPNGDSRPEVYLFLQEMHAGLPAGAVQIPYGADTTTKPLKSNRSALGTTCHPLLASRGRKHCSKGLVFLLRCNRGRHCAASTDAQVIHIRTHGHSRRDTEDWSSGWHLSVGPGSEEALIVL